MDARNSNRRRRTESLSKNDWFSDSEAGNTDCLAFLEFSCEPLKEWFERRWQTDNSPHAIRCIKD